MALTERFENDKIEVVGQYKAIQVRRATVIERDGVEINRSFHRHVLQPGTVAEGTSTLTDTDISGEDADVQAICTAAWTDAVKEAWRVKLVNEAVAAGIATS
tara:strand:+ start:1226 stop:1531 length:306 start_codon:yes stop_codon:yes gene_type:complete